jgi:small multidrug resistance pump|tara:strand:+ start:241 stop:579 length:339 start_codon:yes stop_codon:yes gene_type:complete
MSVTTSYLFLVLAVILGVTSNSFAKNADGFTLLIPSIITGTSIILCMYALSIVMKTIPMGITYASFAGLAIVLTVVVGIVKYNQVPNFYTIIGLILILVGVLMVNLLSRINT